MLVTSILELLGLQINRSMPEAFSNPTLEADAVALHHIWSSALSVGFAGPSEPRLEVLVGIVGLCLGRHQLQDGHAPGGKLAGGRSQAAISPWKI